MEEIKSKVPGDKFSCCGCGVCKNVCPVAAISMEMDKEGFLYPVVNDKICVNCGLCIKKCAFFNRTDTNKKSTQVSAVVAKHSNLNIRMNSRSGAIFIACSDWILNQGGVVYGCILNEKLEAVHIGVKNKIDRDKMCGSKYVQSNTVEIWKQIKIDIEQGKKVLFSGTPCQIDALYTYLKTYHITKENLFTIDLICHGVPSPKLFEEYIQWLEKKYNGKINKFNFRDKSLCGWDGHIESYNINNKKYSNILWREIFYTNCCIRPSCLKCKYATLSRIGDLTFGDAWGIKSVKPEFNDNRGVSVVITNSNKGHMLLEQIKLASENLEVPIEKMLQPNLKQPSQPKMNREIFWNTYKEGGIQFLITKYGRQPVHKKIKAKFKYKLRQLAYKKKGYYLP